LLKEDQLDERLEQFTALMYPAISEKAKAAQQNTITAFNGIHIQVEFHTCIACRGRGWRSRHGIGAKI
jgi:hypothetical protein